MIVFFLMLRNLNSPSLTTKKSNEIIQGGFSSIKSVATNMVKKLDGIKEAISATTTPVKLSGLSSTSGSRNSTLERLGVSGRGGDGSDIMPQFGEGESTDGSEGGDHRMRRISAEFPGYRDSTTNLKDVDEYPPTFHENLYPTTNETAGKEIIFS